MSPGLRGEFTIQLNSEWMHTVGLLRQLSIAALENNSLLLQNFLYEVSTSMGVEAHAQAAVFGAPHVLFIMNRGLVGRHVRVLRRGQVWGVDFLLANPVLLEPVESFALTYVEVTTLSRSEFYRL